MTKIIHLKCHQNLPGANELMLFTTHVILFEWNWSNIMIFLVTTVDTDDLVLWHQGISNLCVEYTPMCFQLFMG